jgi:hypothetical protein
MEHRARGTASRAQRYNVGRERHRSALRKILPAFRLGRKTREFAPEAGVKVSHYGTNAAQAAPAHYAVVPRHASGQSWAEGAPGCHQASRPVIWLWLAGLIGMFVAGPVFLRIKAITVINRRVK